MVLKAGNKIKESINEIRAQFPILQQEVNGKPLVYFDNAATTQKPISVIDAITSYYKEYNSNIHRGAHFLANKATEAYEAARDKVANFINAESSDLVNFTKGTTEGINLIAHTYGKVNLQEGDNIIVSGMEHHSNIVPWQILAESKKAKVEYLLFDEEGRIDLDDFRNKISSQTKIVSLAYVSNALGSIHPVEEIIRIAHNAGAIVVLDAAQAAPHVKINVQELDVDFISFSAHKIYGPTGMGILYGKRELLESMPPFLAGGEMIDQVTLEGSTFNKLPYKFEAGTPNICGGIATGAAIDFIESLDINAIAAYENELLQYATQKVKEINGLKIVGDHSNKAAVLSFLMDGIHSYDIGVLLDKMGIAIRTGHHCCQPLMNSMNIDGTARASFAVYNTLEEIDVFVEALKKAKMMLS